MDNERLSSLSQIELRKVANRFGVNPANYPDRETLISVLLDHFAELKAEREHSNNLQMQGEEKKYEISKDEEPESKVARLIREYEAGKEHAKSLIREISQLCIGGFEETLGKAGISFDSWDWESDFVWNSDVKKVLNKLEATSYVFSAGQVSEFDLTNFSSPL